jgi:benzodiazapine receptor
MGYSAYRAYNTGTNPLASAEKLLLTKQGATLYTVQLGLNLVVRSFPFPSPESKIPTDLHLQWMPLFFVAKRPIEATVDIAALTGTVGYLAYIWGQVDHISAWALAPYLGWLGFATYLSAGVGYLNDWDTKGKEVDFPPSHKTHDTKFVDEKDE